MGELTNNQSGWVGQLLLWLLAGIGLLAVGFITLATLNYQPGGPASVDGTVAEVAEAPLLAGSSKVSLSADRQATFDRSCAVCHNNVGTGAPKTADAAAWQPRLDQGMALLLEHTLKGRNAMPPMGMCMDCEQKDFVAFIEYMGQFDSGMECDE